MEGYCFLEILKKKKKRKALKKKKKSSENDQSTGHFQSFFIYFFFRPRDPRSEKKNPVNQLIKKNLALFNSSWVIMVYHMEKP